MPMNYRHAYHAGNHGDVLKHVLLTRALSYLTKKTSPLAVLDAHAGIGFYDLTGLEALKTGEWRGGIGRLLASSVPDDAANLLSPYFDLVRRFNSNGTLRRYPGSPVLARGMLRGNDRLLLNELHGQDHLTLLAEFQADPQVRVLSVDAAQVIKASLPFVEKRGLVLIDPAFEVTDETQRVSRMVAQALRRMAHVCLMIWYPVTTQEFADRFCDELTFQGARSVLRAELVVRQPQESAGLCGSGVIIVNPPWTLRREVTILLPTLAIVLGESGQGRFKLDWLVEPT
jgi:23S rRNA (adenine2030-N6)-methyltransferase